MPTPTSAQKDEIRRLLASGNKIEAIKQFRNIADVGLTEAMAAINAMESPRDSRTVNAIAPKALREAESAALAALREGNSIEAIKRYRKHAKVDLRAAKLAVDALSASHGSGGRVTPRLATALLALVEAGRQQDAVTQLMSQVGFDEAEAKAFLATLRAGPMRAGSRGCNPILVVLVLLLGIVIALFLAAP